MSTFYNFSIFSLLRDNKFKKGIEEDNKKYKFKASFVLKPKIVLLTRAGIVGF